MRRRHDHDVERRRLGLERLQRLVQQRYGRELVVIVRLV
jgi:hypothetical protein